MRIRQLHRGRLVVRVAAVTLLAEVGSVFLFILARLMANEPINAQDWLETTLIPPAVAIPIATYVFVQAEKLRAAFEQLDLAKRDAERSHRQLQEAHDIISFAAKHDRMTGLLNREAFMGALEKDHAHHRDGVLLIVDADRFKEINDRYGHMAGDAALVAIAQAIKRGSRRGALVGRIGGEEFGVWLRELSIAEAAEVGESIRREVAASSWSHDEKLRRGLSISVGGAAARDCADSLADLFVQADRCLYDAKRAGRNCIAFNRGVSDMAHSMAKAKG